MDEMDLTGSGVTGAGGVSSGGALDLEPLYRSISDLPLPPITHQQSSDDQFDPPAILDTFTRAELDEHTFNYGNVNAVPQMTVPMRESSIGFINNFDFANETPATAVASAATSYFAQFSGLATSGVGSQYDAFTAYEVAEAQSAASRKRQRHDPYDGFFDQTNNVTIATAIPIPARTGTTVSESTLPTTRPVLTANTRSAPGVQRAYSVSSDSDLSTQSARSPISPSTHSSPIAPSPNSPKDSVSDINGGGVDKDEHKKIKHQMTDRQRRAKIKESMDQLKALVPLEKDQKADQATIVQQSVELVKGLKDEVAELKKRLAEMEINKDKSSGADAEKNIPLKNYLVQQSYQSSSPFSAMMASLNGAGVCMWRVGLDGRILDVNLVFEMVTGWTSADVVNKSPCSGPLYGSLSVMPKSFLRFFSQVSALVSPITTSATSTSSSPPQYQQTQPSIFPTLASASSPLFSSITISSLPIVPQNELQSFFPFKCRTFSAAANDPTGGPQPHGQYLINHLANLPPSHVLKLLARVSTSYGDTLESIQTMCLVRTATGAPDYILCLTTPDGRRLVKPTKFLQPISPLQPQPQPQSAQSQQTHSTSITA